MSNEEIRLIVPSTAPSLSENRGGGVQHGVVSVALARAVTAIPPEAFANALAMVISQLSTATTAVQDAVHGFEVSEITVALAVNADGNIGIAAGGIEGSIEVKLRRSRVAMQADSS